jgi:hypothetical protein
MWCIAGPGIINWVLMDEKLTTDILDRTTKNLKVLIDSLQFTENGKQLTLLLNRTGLLTKKNLQTELKLNSEEKRPIRSSRP